MLEAVSLVSSFFGIGGVIIAGMALRRDTNHDNKTEGQEWATLRSDINYLKEHIKDLSDNITKIDLKLDNYSERIAKGEERIETLFRKCKDLEQRVLHLEERCKKQ